jgi:hypothetical protein
MKHPTHRMEKTTVGDMVWGVRFFQTDKLLSFSDAVFAISMVPLGWVFGCPLGWLADWLGRPSSRTSSAQTGSSLRARFGVVSAR